MVAKAAADHQPVLPNALGITWEKTLPRGVDTSAKKAPLPTVCVSADGQFNVSFFDCRNEILGVMTKQNSKTVSRSKFCKRVGVGFIFFTVDAGCQSAQGEVVVAYQIVVQKGYAAFPNACYTCIVQGEWRGMTPRIALVIAGDLVVTE